MTPAPILRTLVVGDLSCSLLHLLFYYSAENVDSFKAKESATTLPVLQLRKAAFTALDHGRLSQTFLYPLPF